MTNHLGSPRPRPYRAASFAIVSAALACSAGDGGARTDGPPRGSAASIIELSANERAGAYAAALEQAFEIGPSLVLMLDPPLLPAGGGYSSRSQVPADVRVALRATGTIQGTCEPVRDTPRAAPVCLAELPGYAVRVSDVFRAAGDTVRLYVAAERFRLSRDGARYAPPFAFEDRYSLVRRDDRWVVVKKERKRLT